MLAASVGVQVLRVIQAWFLGVGARHRARRCRPTSSSIPVILLIMLLPITINGIGTSQAAFIWCFGAVGVGRPEAFALSVLFVALGVVGNLPGGLLYATGGMAPADRHDRARRDPACDPGRYVWLDSRRRRACSICPAGSLRLCARRAARAARLSGGSGTGSVAGAARSATS